MMFWLVGGFLGLIVGGMLLAALLRGDSEDALIAFVALATVLGLGALVGALARRSASREWRDVWRLVALATANGLEVAPAAKPTRLPGSFFAVRSHTRTRHRVRWTVEGREVETAEHSYWANGSRAGRYLAVRVPDVPRLSFFGKVGGQPRPQVVLGTELTVHGGDASLPERSRRGKVLSAAKDAARVKAFFTDELVELLTDPAHPCHAEVAGGWFFAYQRGGRQVGEARWRHSFALAEAVVRAAEVSRAPLRQDP